MEKINIMSEVFESLLDSSEIKNLEDKLRDIFSSFLYAPETTLQDMLKLFSESIGNLPSKNLPYDYIIRVGDMWGKWAFRQELDDKKDRKLIKEYPCLQALISEILNSILKNPNRIHDLQRIHAFNQQDTIIRWTRALSPLMRPMPLPYSNFETSSILKAEFLSNLAETYYKDHLVLIYTIMEKSDKKNNPPTLLGDVMAKCKNSWSQNNPALLNIIKRDLLIIRNSQVHKNTMLNLEDNTITFINKRAKSDDEILGPLNFKALHDLENTLAKFLLALNPVVRLVFRRFWMMQQMSENL